MQEKFRASESSQFYRNSLVLILPYIHNSSTSLPVYNRSPEKFCNPEYCRLYTTLAEKDTFAKVKRKGGRKVEGRGNRVHAPPANTPLFYRYHRGNECLICLRIFLAVFRFH